MPKKPTIGRPRKPANSKKSVKVSLRLTPAEHAMIQAQADAAQLTLRDYVVALANRKKSS